MSERTARNRFVAVVDKGGEVRARPRPEEAEPPGELDFAARFQPARSRCEQCGHLPASPSILNFD
jgi:hypothetical protein